MNERITKYIGMLVLFVISTMGLLMVSEGNVFSVNMVTYSPAEIHAYDSSLFSHDIDVETSDNALSPRAGSIFIISTLMKWGLTYECAYLLIFFITCCIAAIGCLTFVNLAEFSNKLLGVLLYTAVLGINRIHFFAGFYSFTTNSIFIGLGSVFGILAIILMLYKPTRKNVELAYLLVAIAAVCHIHEGIWAFCLLSFIYLLTYRNIPYKNIAFYISILAIIGITLPAILSGAYTMPSDEFYSVYVEGRIPHHLMVSHLEGWGGVLSLAVVYGLIIWVSKEELKREKKLSIYNGLVILFFFTIAFWYVSTEILHISTFIKLYLAKFVKYISIPFLLLLIQYLYKVVQEQKLLAIAMILCLPVNREIWLYIMIFSHLVYYTSFNSKWQKYIVWGLVYIICILLLIWQSPLAVRSVKFLLVALLLLLTYDTKGRYMWQQGVIVILFVLGFGAYMYKNKAFSYRYIDEAMASKMEPGQYVYARMLSDIVPKDAVILSDAMEIGNGYVQHVSRRSMYALYKTVPSSDLGIKIWHDRIIETKDFCQWTPEQTAEFMQEKELQYVTVNTQNMTCSYEDCSLYTKEAEQGNFVLYKLQQ